MCGRTACTLNPENLRRACQYKGQDVKLKKPDWKDAPCGNQYLTSSNIPPTVYTPVLFGEGDRVLQPMMWGLVPSWHKGSDPKSHGLSTNNARLEGVKDSKLYSSSLSRRCVVAADGFYEWKRDGDVKQPYLVYVKQGDGVRIGQCGMPCFLDEEAVNLWLDSSLTPSQALSSLKLPSEGELSWHTVSSAVGNSRNKDMDFVNEVAPKEREKKGE